MLQSVQVFASSAAAIDAGRRTHRQNGLSAVLHAPSVTDQSQVPSARQTNDAEAIIGELVNQYFCCSTTTSGIFCW